MAQSRPVCPSCRHPHNAVSVDQLPVGFNTERIINEHATSGVPFHSVDAEENARAVLPSALPSRRVLQKEGDNKLRSIITSRQKTRSDVHKYEENLKNAIAEHEEFQDTIKIMGEQNMAVLQRLKEEHERIHNLKLQDDTATRDLEATRENLTQAEATTEIALVVDHVDECYKEAEEWNLKCQQEFPDVAILQDSVDVSVTDTFVVLTMV